MALFKVRGMTKSGHDGKLNLHYQAGKDWKDCAARLTPGSNKMQLLN